MTLSLTAPSASDSLIPFIRVLLVTPATTILPSSSNSTTAGRSLTSKESANWTCAKTTSPGLSMLPRRVFLVVPEFLHLGLLDAMQELVVLVVLLGVPEQFRHFDD